MGAISDARNELATALAGTGYVVYSEPAETMVTPSLVLVPDAPYVAVQTITRTSPRLGLSYKVWLQVAWRDNKASLFQLEALIEKVLAVVPNGVVLGAFDKPQMQTVGDVKMLVTSVDISKAI